jgi:hypothetical protein
VPHCEEEKSSLKMTRGLGVEVGPVGSSPPSPPATALHANAASAKTKIAKITCLFLFIVHSPLNKLSTGLLRLWAGF